jgi:hypothetical protein
MDSSFINNIHYARMTAWRNNSIERIAPKKLVCHLGRVVLKMPRNDGIGISYF